MTASDPIKTLSNTLARRGSSTPSKPLAIYSAEKPAHTPQENIMKRAVLPVIVPGFAGPVWVQDSRAGMTPIISTKYGERICGYKVNLKKLTDYIEQVSDTPVVSVFQDQDLPRIMEQTWKQYDEMGKAKAYSAILREYGPRGTVARGIVSK
jgi:hypothetical protein